MDEALHKNSGTISHSLAGALCIFATREEGVIEYFKNLDGFRLEEDGTIHAIQFCVDRWLPFTLEGYKLIAMRSIRDHAHLMTSNVIEFFFNDTCSKLSGIKIVEETHREEIIATHHIIGDCSSHSGIRKKVHYNAGIKTIKDIMAICLMEIESLKNKGVTILFSLPVENITQLSVA